jgi:hypothetical protein
MRIAVALFIALGASGCASPPKSQFLWYSFTDGKYSELLHSTFGEDEVYSGTAFYELPNLWNRIEPNGLLLSPGRARYVWVENGKAQQVDMTPESCPQLAPLLTDFDSTITDTLEYAFGRKKFEPGPSPFDPPDYVIEIHGDYANVVIDPKRFSFPSIDVARKITMALRACHDS